MEKGAFKKRCFQWFADFVARYLAIINSSINFLIYCLVAAILHNIDFMSSHHDLFLTVEQSVQQQYTTFFNSLADGNTITR